MGHSEIRIRKKHRVDIHISSVKKSKVRQNFTCYFKKMTETKTRAHKSIDNEDESVALLTKISGQEDNEQGDKAYLNDTSLSHVSFKPSAKRDIYVRMYVRVKVNASCTI